MGKTDAQQEKMVIPPAGTGTIGETIIRDMTGLFSTNRELSRSRFLSRYSIAGSAACGNRTTQTPAMPSVLTI
jgi:hypothetical protein